MIRGYSAEAVRAAEAPLLDAGEPLMLRAAHALAGHVHDLLAAPGTAARSTADEHGTVLVLAGAGANGGDGLHAAAMLRRAGIDAHALLTADTCHAEGAESLRRAGGILHSLTELTARPGHALEELLDGADLVLDAILGIGGRPEVPDHLRPLLDHLRAAGTPVIAVDLPSFLDATTGDAAEHALPARATATFGAVKAGLLLPGGSHLTGELHLVDLGLEPHLPTRPLVERLEDEDVRRLWPRAGRDDSKYTRGVVAIAAGSTRYPGAAVLACSGAGRAGAGMVRCLAPDPVLDLVLRARPEVLGHPVPAGGVDLEEVGRTQALVVGPGLSGDDARARTCIDAVREDGPGPHRGVIDAGGLDALTTSDRFCADVVLTPHRGEAQRLARRLDLDPELSAAPLARALADATGATVLMKGAVSVIAPPEPEAPLLAQDDATGYLATAGTGDVLAGILGTLLAAGLPGPEAAALASLLHGRAGRAASHGGLVPLVALDVADRLPEVLATILTGREHHSEASEGER